MGHAVVNGLVGATIGADATTRYVQLEAGVPTGLSRLSIGYTNVGRIIGTLAANFLEPAVLELGGKNTVIVLADANVDYAVDAAAFAAFMNSGQIRMSADRVPYTSPWPRSSRPVLAGGGRRECRPVAMTRMSRSASWGPKSGRKVSPLGKVPVA
ncbi:hypothetical protein GCM10010306_092360 [Streptomyces umbrinus]|nr:hypothetical protein GCM10010306_092360 [Streptomyces umbrinus]